MWKKTGLLLEAPPQHSHAALPFAHAIGGDAYKLYFSSRDAQSRSHTFCADMRITAHVPAVNAASLTPILAPGDLGTFDDSGAMPSWVVSDGPTQHLYYTGWSLGKTVPFYTYIGLATDNGKGFTRHSRAPVMAHSPIDPYMLNSPCVLRENGIWKMWYVSGTQWKQTPEGPAHSYLIRYAQSPDGIHWTAREEPCIAYQSEGEYAIARPCVVPVEGGYLMWYSTRGQSYRLGFAASRDGLHWQRFDHLAGMDVSQNGWDSEMIAFAHVFKTASGWCMLYNGNGYGKTGIGAATAPTLPTIAELL